MAEKNVKQASAKLIYPEPTDEDRRVYANYVQVNHTPWDFALHFGLVTTPTVPPQPNPEGYVEIPVSKLLTVNIPVPLIHGLIKALQTQVETYEKQYGETKPSKGEK